MAASRSQRWHTAAVSTDWDKLLRGAVEQGWLAERRSRHIWLWAPSGGTVSLPTSPSDHRSIHNCVADMRRLGFVWHGRAGKGSPPEPIPTGGPDKSSMPSLVDWALAADERLYDVMVREQRPLSVTEMSGLTGLSRSTVRLIGEALTKAGFLQRAGVRSRVKRGVRPDPVYVVPGMAGPG